MITADAAARRPIDLSRANFETLMTMLLAGSVATVVFDIFGQSVSPGLGFPGLSPVPLANQAIQVLTGHASRPGAHLLHYVAGLIAYPFGWLFAVRPLARRLAPGLHWLAASAIYGAGLWIFALYVMAHLVAGNPAFLGFTSITWVALAGHILYAMATAWVVARREAG